MNDIGNQKKVLKYYRPNRVHKVLEIIREIIQIIVFLLIGGLIIKLIVSGVWFK